MVVVTFGNIAIWLVEKFVPWDFEFLAVSYMFSEMILLGVYWMMQDCDCLNQIENTAVENAMAEYVNAVETTVEQKVSLLILKLKIDEDLSAREREILKLIIQNKKRKDIANDLHLSENTIKTHTRTLYAKLGVRSRQELYVLLEKNY